MAGDVIICDNLPGYSRVAVVRNHQLDALFIDDDAHHAPRPGAVVAVRVQQVFPQHGRVTAELMGEGVSFRTAHPEKITPGQMIAAKVQADARQEAEIKPLQLKEYGGVQDMPMRSGVITPAPDALARARALLPDADVIADDEGKAWADHDIDAAIDSALKATIPLADGARLHLNAPPGAVVVDGDSGSSQAAPQQLAEIMVEEVMRQLRLRRHGGPIVIDFPRLSPQGQKAIHGMMRDAARLDPAKPALHGFTRGGLYTMARPWQLMPLAQELAPSPRRAGLAALRLIRNHGLHHGKAAARSALGVRLHPDALKWIEGDGAPALHALGLAFSPEFVSDACVDAPRLDNGAKR